MYPMVYPSRQVRSFSVFSHSLGDHSVHELPSKIEAAAGVGLKAIELSLIDLEHHSFSQSITLLDAAREIGLLCEGLGLSVVCLQPIRDLIEANDPSWVERRVLECLPLMDELKTDLMVCCSSSLPPNAIAPDSQSWVDNLKLIGTLCAAHPHRPKRVAFEALCWGTYINKWSEAWEVVKRVNMMNVGICLDSFNTIAREWADPTLEGGIQAGADQALSISLQKMVQEIPSSKVFLLQIADGRKLKEPIEKGTFEAPALMNWSRSSRLFPMEKNIGGYLPVQEFVMAVVLGIGYKGVWSSEVFNRSLFEEDPSVPVQHASRAIEGLKKLNSVVLMYFNPTQKDHVLNKTLEKRASEPIERVIPAHLITETPSIF